MKVLLIIRTYPKEEHLAYYCLATAVQHNVCDEALFMPQEGTYKGIMNKYEKRSNAGNMCGLGETKIWHNSAVSILSKYKGLYDYYIVSDSDVSFKKSFRHLLIADHAGVFHSEGYINNDCKHISGQCQIYSKRAFDRYCETSIEDLEKASAYIIANNYSVADDTLYSVIMQVGTGFSRLNINGGEYWDHDKFIWQK